MSRRDQAAKRDPEKEAFWRAVLGRYQKSGLSQAEFCRREGLNPQNFSSWKGVLARRDLEQARKRIGNSGKQENSRSGMDKAVSAKEKKPAFVRLQIAAEEELGVSEADKGNRKPQPNGNNHQVIAAELTAPGGCQVRIFNGADSSTLSALIQALANS